MLSGNFRPDSKGVILTQGGNSRIGPTWARPSNPDKGWKIGWSVFILPFIEQNNLLDQFKAATNNWEDDWSLVRNPAGTIVATVQIPFVICGSDASPDGNVNKLYIPHRHELKEFFNTGGATHPMPVA